MLPTFRSTKSLKTYSKKNVRTTKAVKLCEPLENSPPLTRRVDNAIGDRPKLAGLRSPISLSPQMAFTPSAHGPTPSVGSPERCAAETVQADESFYLSQQKYQNGTRHHGASRKSGNPGDKAPIVKLEERESPFACGSDASWMGFSQSPGKLHHSPNSSGSSTSRSNPPSRFGLVLTPDPRRPTLFDPDEAWGKPAEEGGVVFDPAPRLKKQSPIRRRGRRRRSEI
ncbi:hypothetical protein Cob_v000841 [Colletotrichum orbiculare MAFF 240422]|uniref:Uncharacterized protein n=1 Tax=Colletotrichum orbiculare (strain 104-T / ATCC 96160 / CBS 514.97 / LARS 414 / MAFF 240422) TaxID=1213857 RepID=A0A484G619_COLOR|nr:hypothetical protein Cob_v000841 [Colletotrichum orbiculare MAFF 240422]